MTWLDWSILAGLLVWFVGWSAYKCGYQVAVIHLSEASSGNLKQRQRLAGHIYSDFLKQ